MKYRVFEKPGCTAYVRQDDHETADDLFLEGWREMPKLVDFPKDEENRRAS